jgi:hypothetical protein
VEYNCDDVSETMNKFFFKSNDGVFITNQHVIICPRRRGQLEDIGFDQIKEVRLRKGMFRTELTLIRTEEEHQDIEITKLKNYEAFSIYAHLRRYGIDNGDKIISKDRLHFSEVVKNNILVLQGYRCGCLSNTSLANLTANTITRMVIIRAMLNPIVKLYVRIVMQL